MNPCGCRSTAHVPPAPTRDDVVEVQSRPSSSAALCKPASLHLCSPPKPRRAPTDRSDALAPAHVVRDTPRRDAAALAKTRSASAVPSIELLLRAVDMTTEFVPPPCACGPGCRCSRCLAKSSPNTGLTDLHRSTPHHASSTVSASSASPRTPPATLAARSAPGCDDCAACDWPSSVHRVSARSTAGWRSSATVRLRDAARLRPTGGFQCQPHARVESTKWSAGQLTIVASVPTMHGGLLTAEDEDGDEVHAELVLVHPKCAACLEVVRARGVGVLCSAK